MEWGGPQRSKMDHLLLLPHHASVLCSHQCIYIIKTHFRLFASHLLPWFAPFRSNKLMQSIHPNFDSGNIQLLHTTSPFVKRSNCCSRSSFFPAPSTKFPKFLEFTIFSHKESVHKRHHERPNVLLPIPDSTRCFFAFSTCSLSGAGCTCVSALLWLRRDSTLCRYYTDCVDHFFVLDTRDSIASRELLGNDHSIINSLYHSLLLLVGTKVPIAVWLSHSPQSIPTPQYSKRAKHYNGLGSLNQHNHLKTISQLLLFLE